MDQDLSVRLESAVDFVQAARIGGQFLERGGQAGLVHVDRSNSTGDIPRLDDGVLQELVELRRRLRFRLEAL